MPKKRRTPTVVTIEDPDVIDLTRLGFKSLTIYRLAIFRTPPPTPKKRAVTRVYQTLRASFRRVVEQRRRPPTFIKKGSTVADSGSCRRWYYQVGVSYCCRLPVQ